LYSSVKIERSGYNNIISFLKQKDSNSIDLSYSSDCYPDHPIWNPEAVFIYGNDDTHFIIKMNQILGYVFILKITKFNYLVIYYEMEEVIIRLILQKDGNLKSILIYLIER
jgi:hypothetical protein